MNKVTRKIIEIDEDLCDGCEICIPACPEQAIEIVDTPEGPKARLVREIFCDGLGACLGNCPTGALTIVEREVDSYDEEATIAHIKEVAPEMLDEHLQHMKEHADELPEHHSHKMPPSFKGCPSAQIMQWEEGAKESGSASKKVRFKSALRQWPIQLHLVPPFAPYFKDADLAIVADCVPFTYANFHEDFLEGKALAVGCPKLDDVEAYIEKIAQIIKLGGPKSVEVVIMEVPCCGGLTQIVQQAMEKAGRQIPISETVISIRGEEEGVN
jgi:NAD-dependent dihydropyrimidine dehydrogenase PreA subunit